VCETKTQQTEIHKTTLHVQPDARMHDLFIKVLSKRDLSRAGDLFSVADSEIVHDLSEVVRQVSRAKFLVNDF
jgi:hypothetical protein